MNERGDVTGVAVLPADGPDERSSIGLQEHPSVRHCQAPAPDVITAAVPATAQGEIHIESVGPVVQCFADASMSGGDVVATVGARAIGRGPMSPNGPVSVPEVLRQ